MNSMLLEPSLDRFCKWVAWRFGLNLDTGNRDRLAEALERGIDRTGAVDAGRYLERLVEGTWPEQELAAIISDLTVAETYFFRHPDQFRAVLERVILPCVIARDSSPRLQILSAGCASGEEAFSLAILLRDHLPPHQLRDVEIIGLDVNVHLLAKAQRGRYSAWSLRGVPEEVKQRHFDAVGNEFILKAPTRKLARFVCGNLIDDDAAIWQPDRYDVIFCRNVSMYFTPAATCSAIARLARSLVPGGLLFLGPAETLRGVSQDFHLQHTHDTFYYQRRRSRDHAAARTGAFPLESLPAGSHPAAADEPQWVSDVFRASQRVASLSADALARGTPSPAQGQAMSGAVSALDADSGPSLDAALRLLREERFQDALALLQPLAITGDESSDLRLLVAAVLANSGQMQEAQELCQAVLAQDERSAEAHYLLALCHECSGEVQAAIEENQVAIYIDPHFAMPHLHVGLVLKRAGDRPGAQRAFGRAADLLIREDPSRIVLYGGGFDRAALVQLCLSELRAQGGCP